MQTNDGKSSISRSLYKNFYVIATRSNISDYNFGGADSPFTSVNSSQETRTQTKDTTNVRRLSTMHFQMYIKIIFKLVKDDGADTSTTQTGPHFLTIKFYQQYFDVDTELVYTRLLNSVVPRRSGNFIRDYVQPNPDFYAPIWIAVCILFCGQVLVHATITLFFVLDYARL